MEATKNQELFPYHIDGVKYIMEGSYELLFQIK